MLYASIVFIVNNFNDVLILKRSKDSLSFPGVWALPGGKIEEGETPEEAAIREIMEETQINLNPDNLNFLYKELQGEKEFFFFSAFSDFIIPVIDSEHEDWLWIDKGGLKEACAIPIPDKVWEKFEAL